MFWKKDCDLKSSSSHNKPIHRSGLLAIERGTVYLTLNHSLGGSSSDSWYQSLNMNMLTLYYPYFEYINFIGLSDKLVCGLFGFNNNFAHDLIFVLSAFQLNSQLSKNLPNLFRLYSLQD